MRAGLGAFVKGLFVREQAPEVMPSGLLRWGRMDERFRERCAVWADGRVMIAEGFVVVRGWTSDRIPCRPGTSQ